MFIKAESFIFLMQSTSRSEILKENPFYVVKDRLALGLHMGINLYIADDNICKINQNHAVGFPLKIALW